MSSEPMAQRHENPGDRRKRGGLLMAVCCVLASCLASCASKEKKAGSSYSDLTMGQRFVKQTKDPHAIKSPFQQDVFRSGRNVKTANYKAGDYKGRKGFFGSNEKYKAGTFAQADKASHASGQQFSGADDKSRMADSTYKTSQNAYDGQVNRNAGRVSSMNDDTYDAGGNPELLQGTQNVKRPLIERDEEYSESFIKRLLNKG